MNSDLNNTVRNQKIVELATSLSNASSSINNSQLAIHSPKTGHATGMLATVNVPRTSTTSYPSPTGYSSGDGDDDVNPYFHSVTNPFQCSAKIPDLDMTQSIGKVVSAPFSYKSAGSGTAMIVFNGHSRDTDQVIRLYGYDVGTNTFNWVQSFPWDNDLAKNFKLLRLVSAGISVASATYTGAAFGVSGTMNAVAAFDLPDLKTLTLSSIPSYERSPGNGIGSVPISDGIVALSCPTGNHAYHAPTTSNNYDASAPWLTHYSEVKPASVGYPFIAEVYGVEVPINTHGHVEVSIACTVHWKSNFPGLCRLRVVIQTRKGDPVTYAQVLTSHERSMTTIFPGTVNGKADWKMNLSCSLHLYTPEDVESVQCEIFDEDNVLSNGIDYGIEFSSQIKYFNYLPAGSNGPAAIIAWTGTAVGQELAIRAKGNYEVVPDALLAQNVSIAFTKERSMDLEVAEILFANPQATGLFWVYTGSEYASFTSRGLWRSAANRERLVGQASGVGDFFRSVWRGIKNFLKVAAPSIGQVLLGPEGRVIGQGVSAALSSGIQQAGPRFTGYAAGVIAATPSGEAGDVVSKLLEDLSDIAASDLNAQRVCILVFESLFYRFAEKPDPVEWRRQISAAINCDPTSKDLLSAFGRLLAFTARLNTHDAEIVVGHLGGLVALLALDDVPLSNLTYKVNTPPFTAVDKLVIRENECQVDASSNEREVVAEVDGMVFTHVPALKGVHGTEAKAKGYASGNGGEPSGVMLAQAPVGQATANLAGANSYPEWFHNPTRDLALAANIAAKQQGLANQMVEFFNKNKVYGTKAVFPVTTKDGHAADRLCQLYVTTTPYSSQAQIEMVPNPRDESRPKIRNVTYGVPTYNQSTKNERTLFIDARLNPEATLIQLLHLWLEASPYTLVLGRTRLYISLDVAEFNLAPLESIEGPSIQAALFLAINCFPNLAPVTGALDGSSMITNLTAKLELCVQSSRPLVVINGEPTALDAAEKWADAQGYITRNEVSYCAPVPTYDGQKVPVVLWSGIGYGALQAVQLRLLTENKMAQTQNEVKPAKQALMNADNSVKEAAYKALEDYIATKEGKNTVRALNLNPSEIEEKARKFRTNNAPQKARALVDSFLAYDAGKAAEAQRMEAHRQTQQAAKERGTIDRAQKKAAARKPLLSGNLSTSRKFSSTVVIDPMLGENG